MNNEAMREALRRIKYEACSLADAQVIALEALAQAEHELEKAEQQEPVAWRAWSEAHGYTVWETLEEAKHYSDEDPEPLDLRHSRKKAEAQALRETAQSVITAHRVMIGRPIPDCLIDSLDAAIAKETGGAA